MRLAALTFIGALGLAAASAQAAPVFPAIDTGEAPGIAKVWGGCGPGFRPAPGHWSRWRGGWVPPHCVPSRRAYYGGGYGYYGGGHNPYWRGQRYWYGY